MSDFAILILVLLSICLIGGLLILRDFLDVIDYIKYSVEIARYNKQYKKYEEEKKHLKKKRLEREREIAKQFNLDYQAEQEYIVGIVKPEGPKSSQEFEKNSEKYRKISKRMQSGSTYWKTLANFASKGRNPGMGR